MGEVIHHGNASDVGLSPGFTRMSEKSYDSQSDHANSEPRRGGYGHAPYLYAAAFDLAMITVNKTSGLVLTVCTLIGVVAWKWLDGRRGDSHDHSS